LPLLLGVSILLLVAGLARVAWIMWHPSVAVDQRGDVVFPVPIRSMPEAARIWIDRDLQNTFNNTTSTAYFAIENVKVERAPDDERKRPWRWLATATLRITMHRGGSVRQRIQGVYCVDPEGQDVGQLSVATEELDGNLSPMVKRLDWSDDFLDRFRKAWAMAQQQIDDSLKKAGPDPDRYKWEQKFRGEMAKLFQISEREVAEILRWRK
jgi:hypothetical protein